MERLGHEIKRVVRDDRWKPIVLGRGGPPLYHIFFIDDLVLFGEIDLKTAESMRSILDDFCLHSGHKVSLGKSRLCFSNNTIENVMENVRYLLGFQQPLDLGMYLGVPLLHTRAITTRFQFIVDKVQRKLNGYNARLLSLAERITLAKPVLLTILGYFMQAAMIPVGVCNKIE